MTAILVQQVPRCKLPGGFHWAVLSGFVKQVVLQLTNTGLGKQLIYVGLVSSGVRLAAGVQAVVVILVTLHSLP